MTTLSNEAPSWDDNAPLIDILLATMTLEKPSHVDRSYETLMLLLAHVEGPEPITKYLTNASLRVEQALRVAAIFIAHIRINHMVQQEEYDPSSPFVFLQALTEVYPVVSCSELDGMSLIASVAHAWKHDLCLNGLTSVAYECMKLLVCVCPRFRPWSLSLTLSEVSRVITLPERMNQYGKESTIDLFKLVNRDDICIISLLSDTLLQSISDGKSLFAVSTSVVSTL